MTEKRADSRVATVLRIKLRYQDVGTFIDKFATNISKGGMFISSRAPKSEGTSVKFELRLADSSMVIAGRGTVRWILPYDKDKPRQLHGMGIEFDDLSEESRALIDQIVERRRTLGLSESEEIPRSGEARLAFPSTPEGNAAPTPQPGPAAQSAPAASAPEPAPAASAPEPAPAASAPEPAPAPRAARPKARAKTKTKAPAQAGDKDRAASAAKAKPKAKAKSQAKAKTAPTETPREHAAPLELELSEEDFSAAVERAHDLANSDKILIGLEDLLRVSAAPVANSVESASAELEAILRRIDTLHHEEVDVSDLIKEVGDQNTAPPPVDFTFSAPLGTYALNPDELMSASATIAPKKAAGTASRDELDATLDALEFDGPAADDTGDSVDIDIGDLDA